MSAPRGPDDALVGRVVAGRYAVRRKLGEGGMGTVYLATHLGTRRACALKVLRPAMCLDGAEARRFRDAAREASRVTHPNVAAVYDVGDADGGLLYLAMEYVAGETLAALLAREGPLAPARAAGIASQIAEALSSAHRLGIVHRDLKPENVMLCRHPDGGDRVKVVDFGLAQPAPGGMGADASGSTSTALVLGTPGYMSPEQFLGEPVDARSDVYALALVTFEMLAGALPFEGAGHEHLIRRLSHPPRALADVRPAVAWPDELERVMRRALALRPAERHATAREFARELARALTA